MAKKKKADSTESTSTKDTLEQAIEKQFGKVIHSGEFLNQPDKKIIKISPNFDLALGGGIPEGSWVVLTGPPKAGKSVTALTIAAKAQALDKQVYYLNVEGRLKDRDIKGIQGLEYIDPKKWRLIASSEDKIIDGNDYLDIAEKFVMYTQGGVLIIDSLSALAAKKEVASELGDVEVAPIQKTQAKFCRRVGNVLPVRRVTLVAITHEMANISFGAMKKTIEKSSSAVQYQTDVKLQCGYFKPLEMGGKIVGQQTHWKVLTSAIGPPGSEFESYIKFGRGIWEELELLEMAIEFGIVKVSGSWVKYNETQVQGKTTFAQLLEDDPELFMALKTEIYDLLGM